MKKILLEGKDEIYCISSLEAEMLNLHIDGYFDNGIVINEGDTVIDVGANIGMFGYKLSKLYKNLNLFAYEPIPDIFKVLLKNSKLSKNINYNVVQCGISDKNESKEIVYFPNSPAMSTFNPEMWDDKNQLLLAFEGSLKHSPKSWWWSKLIPKLFYPLIIKWFTSRSKRIVCDLKTISTIIQDSKIKSVDLIKIDCEGNELKALNGIDDEEWTIISQIIIEVHDIDNALNMAKEILKSKGFKLNTIKEKSLEKTNLYNLIGIK